MKLIKAIIIKTVPIPLFWNSCNANFVCINGTLFCSAGEKFCIEDPEGFSSLDTQISDTAWPVTVQSSPLRHFLNGV